MAWKYVLIGIGVLIAATAYWLYTPLPDDYSSPCAQDIRIALAFNKVIDAVVGVLTIFILVCKTMPLVFENVGYQVCCI